MENRFLIMAIVYLYFKPVLCSHYVNEYIIRISRLFASPLFQTKSDGQEGGGRMQSSQRAVPSGHRRWQRGLKVALVAVMFER